MGEGSTTFGIPYLSKYPDQFYNVSNLPVDRVLLVYKFFGCVNEVDSHNKYLQSDLSMDNLCVTKCGWIWLCTNVAMGITMTNCWKLFRYGVKRDSDIGTISDIMIATAPTNAIGHMTSKEFKLEGGRYNRADRGTAKGC